MTARNTIVFVLGMHRSGTSLTAELVHEMGFSVPGSMLAGNEAVNAHGFWESEEVVSLNESMLDAAGKRWFEVGAATAVLGMQDDLSRQYSAAINSFLQAQAAEKGDLVIKDPRLCLLLPVWLDAVDACLFDVRLIYVNRHPAAVASSLARRDGFSVFSGELLWLSYLYALFGKPLRHDVLFIDYESLLDSPTDILAIASFLGSSAPDEQRLAGIVDAGLQRNRAPGQPQTGEIAAMAFAAYEQLSRLSVVAGNALVLQGNLQALAAFLAGHAELIAALDDANNALVASRANMVELGGLHQQALETISGKDEDIQRLDNLLAVSRQRIAELESAMLEFEALRTRLAEVEAALAMREAGALRTKSYIERCEARIAELHDSMAEFEALRVRMAELEAALQQRDIDIEHNAGYINQCHQRIAELNDSLAEFGALRNRIVELEAALEQRHLDVEHNTDYISQCHQRIAELHDSLAEFEALRARIAEVEAVLQQRDNDLAHNASYIGQCESRIAELHQAMHEFDQLRGRLAEVESALQQRDEWLAERDAAVSQRDQWLAEQAAVIQQRDQLLAERDAAIAAMDNKVAALEIQVASMSKEIEHSLAARQDAEEQTDRVREALSACEARLLEVNARLESLLSSRLVRLLEQYTIRQGTSHD